MKKLLLTSLLGLFGFVGAFASAESFTFISSQDSYKNSLDFTNTFTTQWWFINFTDFDYYDDWQSTLISFSIQHKVWLSLSWISKAYQWDCQSS